MDNKILIVGNFNFGKDAFNGQTVKTRDYCYYLEKRYGKDSVIALDTASWRSSPIKSLSRLIKLLKRCSSVVLMLGVNAACYLVPLICRLKRKYNYKIFWPIIGGSIIYDQKKQKKLVKYFAHVDAIYFETKIMQNYFIQKGYENIFYAPVFSRRKLSNDFFSTVNNGVLRLCTYARVCKEKGISEAINAVKIINKDGVKCTLDVFGAPADDYYDEFMILLNETQQYVRNLPYLNGDNVIDTLSQYDLMLFPTWYSGEGFPIGVIECMMAGVPVIASDWHYNSEFIEHGITGYIYDLNEPEQLVNKISFLLDNRDKLLELKNNAYNYSLAFCPEKVLSHLFEQLDKLGYSNEKNNNNRS